MWKGALMKNEIWKDVAGYGGLYQVSSEGRIKSLKWNKERILKPSMDKDGYLLVTLCAGGKPKTLKVHRLVCEAFHENLENKSDVNHLNEIKTDNRASNLEWCTRRDNINHGSRNERLGKALSKPVCQYMSDGDLVKIWPSVIEAQRQTGFSSASISLAANGKSKQAHGYRWEYV